MTKISAPVHFSLFLYFISNILPKIVEPYSTKKMFQ